MIHSPLEKALLFHTSQLISEVLDDYVSLRFAQELKLGSDAPDSIEIYGNLATKQCIISLYSIFGEKSNSELVSQVPVIPTLQNIPTKRSTEDVDLEVVSPRKKLRNSPRDSIAIQLDSQNQITSPRTPLGSPRESLGSPRSGSLWSIEECEIIISWICGRPRWSCMDIPGLTLKLPGRTEGATKQEVTKLRNLGQIAVNRSGVYCRKNDVDRIDEGNEIHLESREFDDKIIQAFKYLFIQQGCPNNPNWEFFCKYLPGNLGVEDCKALHAKYIRQTL
jgi:hypothetical protein